MVDIKAELLNYDKSQINEAIELQDRLQNLVLPFTSRNTANYQFTKYLEAMSRKINNKEAFATFQENINYPLPTVLFCETISNNISKIFQGVGKYVKYYPDINKDNLPNDNFYKENLYRRFITAPNTLLFIYENETFLIDISVVEMIKLNADNSIKSVYYRNEKNNFNFINDEGLSEYNEKHEFIEGSEIQLELGYTPVTFISNEILNYKKPIVRANFFINQLGEIEELLTIGICSNIINRHLLPYMTLVEKKGCDYRLGDVYCEGGFLKKTIENNLPLALVDEKGNPAKCPHCSKEVGFGSTLRFEAKNLNSEDVAKMISNLLNFVQLDIDHIKLPEEMKKNKEVEIFNKIINKFDNLNNNQQHNETSVIASYEDRLNVLMRWKRTFEIVKAWSITTMLKYRNKNYQNTVASLGDKFYLNSSTEYQHQIKLSYENNSIDYVNNTRGLIEKEYTEDLIGKDRALFILELEIVGKPYFNLNNTQIIDLKKAKDINFYEFYLNQNYLSYIRTIEIEEKTPIDKIAIDKTQDERIFIINNLIKQLQDVRLQSTIYTKNR